MSDARTHDIVVDEVFPHAAGTIWRALTSGALMTRWLMVPDMSKPKRKTVAGMLAEAESSRDDVTTVRSHEAVAASRDQATSSAIATSARDRRDRPGDVVRNGYHASVYLPKEAQFAVREIALHLRHVKPHAVFLEAFADLFDKYHKPELAAECRRRIDPREEDPR